MGLIDADVLETRLANLPGMWASWNHWTRVRAIIEDMPTVDPVKHAYWKYCTSRSVVCSNCGCTANEDANLFYHYCPKCGAKMDDEVTK